LFLLELATSDWAIELVAGVLIDPVWGTELGGWGRT